MKRRLHQAVLPAGGDGAGPWCPDDDTRDSAVARRNVLAGLWAGRLLGLEGEALARYAADVHRSDFATPGDADVILKITSDLHLAGIPISPSAVRRRLQECQRAAWLQVLATD